MMILIRAQDSGPIKSVLSPTKSISKSNLASFFRVVLVRNQHQSGMNQEGGRLVY
jgi:hypothetical protein